MSDLPLCPRCHTPLSHFGETTFIWLHIAPSESGLACQCGYAFVFRAGPQRIVEPDPAAPPIPEGRR